MIPFASRTTAISAIEAIAACGVALSSIEWLVSARHLQDDGLIGWPTAQLRHRALSSRLAGRILDPIFGYPGILWLMSLRLGSALLLVTGLTSGPTRAALTLLVALTTVAITLRSPFGLDGSDQMAAFIFVSLALARILPRRDVEVVFLWVLALQSALAYFTAGYAKLISPIWRSGNAIPGITSTRMYGSRSAARLVRGRRWLWLGLAWSIIVAECLFPLALVAPLPVALALLASGAIFHLLAGVTMGLNTFFWSFLATYPAILWCHSRIHV